MTLSYLSDQTAFNLKDLSEEVLAVFTVDPGTDFANKTQSLLDSKKTELGQKKVKVIFLTTEGSSESIDFILDSNQELLNMASEVQNKKGENLILFKLDGDNLKYLVHKDAPEHEYDWIKVISDFADNYANPEPNDQNMYKWGQIVPEDGDYLCIDCGYIGSFNAGDIFPVCEVCLSGEPAGPTSSDGGYWEKV
ncbi:MAG: hypothetical protein AAGF07_02185 [Patescibacteria group bacterium]